jgi:nucleoside-diphosphate-sugar epimerase
MAIVVTGAGGFVGRQLSRYLVVRGFEVLPLARGVDPVAVLPRASVVVHLAARVHVMQERSVDPLAEFRRSNVDATIALARQAAAAGVARFVFISSVKVNGESTVLGQAFTESDTPSPEDAYGISKYEAEIALREVAAETKMGLVIIRPPLVYGRGVKANFAALMRAVVQRWPLPFGAINNCRSLVGLDNLVDFIHCCITHPGALDQTFLVSDGHDVSSADLVRELALAAGVRPNLWSIPQWLLEFGGALLGKRRTIQRMCGNLQVDISKARMVLGWQPPVSIQEGFKRAVSKV